MTPPDPDRLGDTFALPVAPPPPNLAAAIRDAAVITAGAGVVGALTVGRGLLIAAAAAVGAGVHVLGQALASRRADDDTPAAVRHADTVWDDAGTDAAASALVVWEHLQRAGELPPSALWVLVTDPGGEAPYAYTHARFLSDLFVNTDPRPLDGPAEAPGWLAVVAPAVPVGTAPDITHPDDDAPPVTLGDVDQGTRGRTRVVAVAVTQHGEVGSVSAPLAQRRGRWAVGPITASVIADADGPDAGLAPWLATIAGTTLHTPEEGTR